MLSIKLLEEIPVSDIGPQILRIFRLASHEVASCLLEFSFAWKSQMVMSIAMGKRINPHLARLCFSFCRAGPIYRKARED